jgi:D-glycero-alpha-D-manno-heptose-7-phosphate kinase
MNRIEFQRDGGFTVSGLKISKPRRDTLMENFMLFFTGRTRRSDLIAKDIVTRIGDHERDLAALRIMVDQAQEIITRPDRNLDDIGHLLRSSWALKRGLSPLVSTPELDALHDRAIQAGALGGKLLGAGGGGFFLFYVPEAARRDVRSALSEFTEVSFGIDQEGSKIVLDNRDD